MYNTKQLKNTMKNTMITSVIAIASMFITSCGNSPEDVASEHIRVSMKNPKSYQLDSVKQVDTLTVWKVENAKAMSHVDRFIEEVEKLKPMIEYSILYTKEERDAQSDTCDKYRKIAEQKTKHLDALKGSDKDTVIAYGYNVYYKGTNSFNAVVSEVSRVYVNKNNEVIEPTDLL